MTTIRLLIALTFVIFVAETDKAAAQQVQPREVAALAVTRYFQPAYARLAAETSRGRDAIGELCAAPGQQRLEAARARFADIVTAWSEIELVRFGPVLRDNQLERFLFWPDRRGTALRQVQALLAEHDESATDPASLYAKSVAVQGLGALEYVMFDAESEELVTKADTFRCRYALAILRNLTTLSDKLSAQWQVPGGFAGFANPGPGNATYRTEQEVLNQIVGVLVHGFEAIRDTRLKPMLGTDASSARPKMAPYWRSGLTVASVQANFNGLRNLFEQSRIGELLPADAASFQNSVMFEFGNADRAFAQITLPLEQAVVDTRQYRALGYTVILTQSLQKLIGQDVSQSLGLSVGFSSADGD